MSRYNIGNLILVDESYAVILGLEDRDNWWGGGFYNVYWLTEESFMELSYQQLERWLSNKEAQVFN